MARKMCPLSDFLRFGQLIELIAATKRAGVPFLTMGLSSANRTTSVGLGFDQGLASSLGAAAIVALCQQVDA
jgi:hypothetical protein